MVKIQRLLSLDEMEVIARDATKHALQGYEMPVEQRTLLTLGKGLAYDEGIFELYVPGLRSKDAIVISRAHVDRVSGEVRVEVFLDKPQQPKQSNGPDTSAS